MSLQGNLTILQRPIVHGTKLALGLMKDQKRKNGAIVNIGCTKGISGCKHFPVYASEKSAVHVYSMSQARSEIDKKNKARILVLAPGMTDTEMGALFVDKPEPATNFQSPISVGKAVVFMLKFADSGTLYAIESRKLFKVTWPSKKSTYDFVACM